MDKTTSNAVSPFQYCYDIINGVGARLQAFPPALFMGGSKSFFISTVGGKALKIFYINYVFSVRENLWGLSTGFLIYAFCIGID